MSLEGAPSPAAPPAPRGPVSPWLLVALAAAIVAYVFHGLILPALLGVFLAYLLHPLVARVQAAGIRRGAAVGFVCAAIALGLVVAGGFVLPRVRTEGVALVERLPPLIENGLRRAAEEVRAQYPRLGRLAARVPAREGWLAELVEERIGPEALAEHAGAIVLIVLVTPLTGVFLLRDSEWMIRALMNRLHPVHIETTVAVWCEIDRLIGRYLRGVALVALVVGILATTGLWLIGVPYPLLLGGFTALLNPIPLLGPLTAAATAGLVALATGGGLAQVAWILALYAVLRILDDTVISGIAIGRSVHLHPALVVVAIIAGEQALGLPGMLVAVPAVTVAKETARLLVEHRRTLARLPAIPRGPAGAPHHVV